MGAVPVVLMQPEQSVLRPLPRVLICPAIGPFPKSRLSKLLGLAMGSWVVGTRPFVHSSSKHKAIQI